MSDAGLTQPGPTESQAEGSADHGADLDEDLLEEEWLAETHKRSRGRLVLLCLLGAALMFLAGAQVQRHFGVTPSQSGAAAGLPGGGAGLPSGGLPSGAEIPGAGGGGGGGAGSLPQDGGSAPSGQGDQGTTSAVIGEVVSIKGASWIVKDLGGKNHTIRVTSGTKVVRQQRVASNQVKPGRTVNITGKADGSRRVNASTVTVQ